MTDNERRIYEYLFEHPLSFEEEIARGIPMDKFWVQNNIRNMVKKNYLIVYEDSWSGKPYYRINKEIEEYA